ncbi:uncharacterized protein LOC132743935 [Ruditapes philippinarum]|uniref:uncharacterized protein LOC132743935 n=1 Tax=Ruditapes philippinarum TaxID=129788 RepID=UPI00295A8E59|nr:uncharacterized protein LOC132743935 [Ruditapes philippinarum]
MAAISGSEMENLSDETFQLLCSLCKRKGRTKEADKYCTDCHDYYCSECVKFHEDIPALSGHNILDKSQQETRVGLPVAPTEKCERHRFKPVDMYCQNHDDVGCSTCMAVDHRSCNDIFDVPGFVQINQSQTKKTLEDLNVENANLKKMLETRIHERERLMKDKQEALLKLKDFRREIELKLDKHEQTSIEQIESKCNVIAEKINAEIKVLETVQKDVEHAEDRMVSCDADNNISQAFVSSKIGKRAIGAAIKCREEKATVKHVIDFEFKRNENIMICLNETGNLGNLCQSNEIYKVKKKRTFNVRHQSDTQTCYIYSACELGDGSIILADNNNKKLKRIDSKFTNTDVCELPVSPYQICTINTHDVAAICANGQTVYFVSFAKEPRRTKEINIAFGSYGIAYALSNLYIADSKTTVFVYDRNGTKLKQFTNNQTGQPLFDNIYNMTVNTDGSRIYVADTTFGIVALKEDGTLQGKYNCDELGSVRRVCVADNGNILACGYDNNCILQLPKDGEKLGNVLSLDDTKVGCRSLLYLNKKNELVVGRDDDNIDIYELN